MNTYIILGAMGLLAAFALNYCAVKHLLSKAKDRAYATGYSSGKESQLTRINVLRDQISDLRLELRAMENARERERIEAREALEQAVHDADQRIADAERRALSAEDTTALRCFATQLEAAATTCRNVGATVAADNMKRGAAIARALADRIIPTTESVQLEAAA